MIGNYLLLIRDFQAPGGCVAAIPRTGRENIGRCDRDFVGLVLGAIVDTALLAFFTCGSTIHNSLLP